jgi:hypothetical protein
MTGTDDRVNKKTEIKIAKEDARNKSASRKYRPSVQKKDE